MGSEFQKLLGFEVPLYANSPYMIYVITTLLMVFALIGLSGGLFGVSATKDFDTNFYPLLVTGGVSEYHYILGRLFATWLTALIIMSGIGAGIFAGSILPSNVPAHTGDFRLLSYLHPYIFYIIPDIIILGTVFFTTGLLTRRTIWVYVIAIAFPFILKIFSTPFTWIGLNGAMEFFDILIPSGQETEYWTPVEKNTLPIPVGSMVIANRIFWVSLTCAGIFYLIRYFCFSMPPLSLPELTFKKKVIIKKKVAMPQDASDELKKNFEMPSLKLNYGFTGKLIQLWEQTCFEFRQIAGNKWFWITIFAGILLFIFSTIGGIDTNYGVPAWPTTGHITGITWLFTWLLSLFLVFLLGEILWRERDSAIDSLIDVSVTPDYIFSLAKFISIILIQIAALFLLIIVSIIAQTVSGYFNYEISLYFTYMFTITLPSMIILMIPVLFIHVLINNKYAGHFLSLFLFILIPSLTQMPVINNYTLLLYNYIPLPNYSDMNGYGHYLGPVRWYQLYWILCALIIFILTQLFWVRGVTSGFKERMKLAGKRFTGYLRYCLLLSCLLFIFTGGWIYYNSQILYKTPEQMEETGRDKTMEKEEMKKYLEKYSPFAAFQPVITGVSGDFSVFPGERRISASICYTLKNLTSAPVTDVLVNDKSIPRLTDVKIGSKDRADISFLPGWKIYHFHLPEALAPGEEISLTFNYNIKPSPGFPQKPDDYELVYNGTRLMSDKFLPLIGFMPYIKDELNKDEDEKIDGEYTETLPVVIDEEEARKHGAMSFDGLFIPFHGTISTDSGQTAFLPGSLKKKWTEGERNYFEYESDGPVIMQFFVISGKYDVIREKYKDILLEVYYHHTHKYNIHRLIKGMKTAIDFNSSGFSPYLYHQLRIVELPGYWGMAISTSGTIAFEETMGLLSLIRKDVPGLVDYPFFVTAHETSHQWWGQQLIPARAQGLHIILETLTQYSAITSVEKVYGMASVRNFLKFEMEKYLGERAISRDVPLSQVKGDKDQYIYYRKGAVVMYTLRDYLGEDVLNKALSKFFHDYEHGPPYPLSSDLIDYLRSAAPADKQYILTDLLETITIWDNKTESATVNKRSDGKYDISLTIKARKSRCDSLGRETPVEMKDLIDIGVIGIDGNFIYLEKKEIKTGVNIITVTVDKKPVQAGIDPVYKLIDRIVNDNVIMLKII